MATVRGVCLGLVIGCASPRPYPEAQGDLWVVPLVDQAADSPLLVPVYVHGQGPYVFKIDPDGLTLIDAEIVSHIDAIDHDLDLHPAEATALDWGSLTSHSFEFVGVAPHTLDVDGHRVYGAVGRNILIDSLVFGFNRDRGVAWLATPQGFHSDPAALKWSYEIHQLSGGPGSPQERAPFMTAMINGKKTLMLIDLGQPTSRLRRSLWDSIGIVTVPAPDSRIVDDLGRAHAYNALGEAHVVRVDGIQQEALRFAPYQDDRYYDGEFDGTLGLDFFRGYNVVIDWDHHDLYLSPSPPVAALR